MLANRKFRLCVGTYIVAFYVSENRMACSTCVYIESVPKSKKKIVVPNFGHEVSFLRAGK